MMNANEIRNKEFEPARINGYNKDDVNAFFAAVAADYAQLQNDKAELEQKLEVLADKIREYREDEEALKDALLIAQKQGNAIVAESKASAEKLTKETNEKVEKLLSDSKTKADRLVNDANDYSSKTRAEADATAERIVKDANDKAAEIKAAMDKQQAIQEEILRTTRKEVYEYRARLLAAYKAQVEIIEALPDQIENEFVKKTAEEAEKRAAERKKAEEQKAAKAKADAARNAAAQAKIKEATEKAAAEAAKSAAQPAQNAPAHPVQPAPAKPKPSGKHAGAKPAPKPDATPVIPSPTSGTTPDRTAENNLPFFNTDDQQIARHENLQFGKKNGGKG